jgi:hypothetical protein
LEGLKRNKKDLRKTVLWAKNQIEDLQNIEEEC